VCVVIHSCVHKPMYLSFGRVCSHQHCWIRSPPAWMTWRNATTHWMTNYMNCWNLTGRSSEFSCAALRPQERINSPRTRILQPLEGRRATRKKLDYSMLRKTTFHLPIWASFLFSSVHVVTLKSDRIFCPFHVALMNPPLNYIVLIDTQLLNF
jgi:hypothetical protein